MDLSLGQNFNLGWVIEEGGWDIDSPKSWFKWCKWTIERSEGSRCKGFYKDNKKEFKRKFVSVGDLWSRLNWMLVTTSSFHENASIYHPHFWSKLFIWWHVTVSFFRCWWGRKWSCFGHHENAAHFAGPLDAGSADCFGHLHLILGCVVMARRWWVWKLFYFLFFHHSVSLPPFSSSCARLFRSLDDFQAVCVPIMTWTIGAAR